MIYKLASFRDFFFLEDTGPYDPLRKTSFKPLLTASVLSHTLKAYNYVNDRPLTRFLIITKILCHHHRDCIKNRVEKMHSDVGV